MPLATAQVSGQTPRGAKDGQDQMANWWKR